VLKIDDVIFLLTLVHSQSSTFQFANWSSSGDWDTFSDYNATNNGVRCKSVHSGSVAWCDADLVMQKWAFSIPANNIILDIAIRCRVDTDYESAGKIGTASAKLPYDSCFSVF
jgi:hypothetical protein